MADMSVSGGLFGGLGAIFDKKKLETVYANDYVRDAVKTGVDQSNKDLGLNNTSVASYQAALQAAAPTLATLRDEDLGTYSGLIDSSKTYDPMANYTGVGDYLFDKFGKFSTDLAAQGDAQRKINLANRGYGNTGASAYDSSLLASQISRNLAPAFTSVASMVTPGAQSVASDRYANTQNLVNLMTGRATVPTRDTTNELLPISARSAVTGDYLNNIEQAGTIAKNNIMGYQEKQSDLNRIGSGMVRSMNWGADTGASLLGDYLGAVGGGGLGGGAGAAAGAAAGGGGGSNILNLITSLLSKGGSGAATSGTWNNYLNPNWGGAGN